MDFFPSVLSVFPFPRCVEEMWEVKLDHAAANITTFPPTVPPPSVQYLIWECKEMYDATDVADLSFKFEKGMNA